MTDTRYRCRDHPHQRVTWRGTGCPDSAREAEERHRKRAETEGHR